MTTIIAFQPFIPVCLYRVGVDFSLKKAENILLDFCISLFTKIPI